MKHNGMHVLNFSEPALVRREFIYLRGKHLLGRLVALCFLPSRGQIAVDQMDRQAQRFQGIKVSLVLVGPGAHPLHQLWVGQVEKPWTAVMSDPCGRLHRSFGVAESVPTLRCHTFVIDQGGILRLRVTHDFVDRDLETLRRIIGLNQTHTYDNNGAQAPASDIKPDYLPV